MTGVEIPWNTGVEIPQNTDWYGFPGALVWRFPRTLTGVKIPRNADWCGDPPEH
jgi:hypothetical protein